MIEPETRILALDIGDRRIGIARSDLSGMLASPLGTIEYHEKERACREIVEIAAKQGVARIIVGLPLSMSGTESQQTAKTREFAAKLGGYTNIPLVFYDERLSTVTAREKRREAQNKRKKSKEGLDAAAAAVILQAYLDEKGAVNPQ